MKITDTHVYFWGGAFSNFYGCRIEHEGHQFRSSEQLFMWLKAKFFKDEETAEDILFATSPAEAKHLGRQVKNFDTETWNENCFEEMMVAICCKFDQNPQLKNLLMEHKGKTFVEASPADCIWGVGLHENDPKILDESNWKGMNLLGRCLNIYINAN